MEDLQAGSLWLKTHFHLIKLNVSHRSYIGSNEKIELSSNGNVNQIYGYKYAPTANTPIDHLVFSLKYDDFDLAFYKAVFDQISKQDLIHYINSSSKGKYTRKIGFLYEFLTDEILDISVTVTGNYIDLLESKNYHTGNTIKNKKWKINDNLLGTRSFCPVIKRTIELDELLSWDIVGAVLDLKDNSKIDIFKRAAHYLYNKETKSSYEIEFEKPSPDRMERFIAMLEKAGKSSGNEILGEKELTLLQNSIVDPRFKDSGFRDFQNYIGQSFPDFTEQVHYICPPPNILLSLMEGLRACDEKTQGISSILRATLISFGFVFLHPFEDGNGRLSRFLIHDTLVRDRVVPSGLIIPVSAYILNNMTAYDQALENYSKPLMSRVTYRKPANQEIEITNPEEVEGYYRYPQLTEQCTFLGKSIKSTVLYDMPKELLFIYRYDALKNAVQNIVDLPDKLLNLMIILVHQNKGILPKRRKKKFEMLTVQEIEDIEHSYKELFG